MNSFISFKSLKKPTVRCLGKLLGLLLAGIFMMAGIAADAQPTVTSVTDSNHGKAGYVDGSTFLVAQFHTPMGIAIDENYDCLYVADRDNNAIRMLDLVAGYTSTVFPNAYVPTNLISKPVGVQVDSEGNIFVLNRGSANAFSTNGTVLEFDYLFDLVATNATKLTNATGIALDPLDNIYVTTSSNKVIEISPLLINLTNVVGGVTNVTSISTPITNVITVATIANPGTSLSGIVVKHNGLLAVSDAGRNGIYLINPANGLVTTNAGFNGQGDYTGINNRGAIGTTVKFFQPSGLAEAGDGSLIVADTGNNRVKVIGTTGIVTNLYGVSSNYWSGTTPGWLDGTVKVPDSFTPNVQARLPVGLTFTSDGKLYTTEDYYHLIRVVAGTGLPLPLPPPPLAPTIYLVTTNFGQVTLTWSAVSGALSYNVKRSSDISGPFTTIANVTATTYTDTNVVNGGTYYYVVSALNASSESIDSSVVAATVPLSAVPNPEIGYVSFDNGSNDSVFYEVSPSSVDFNNDATIVIKGTPGTQTIYTTDGSTPGATNGVITNGTTISSSYQDGLAGPPSSAITPFQVMQVAPTLVVKAIGFKTDGSPNSGVVQATFNFITGNPSIVGNNAAQFTVGDITYGAQFLYTTDGSDPRTNVNAAVAGLGANTNSLTLSLQIPANTNAMLFQIVAYKANYQTSSVVSQVFYTTNFLANTISFGFASGEASSEFIGAPGQTFYAPVTLTTLPGAVMYSLQFNITVTNLGPDQAGPFEFQSMLEQPAKSTNTSETVYAPIEPWMYAANIGNVPPSQLVTNSIGQVFVNLETENPAIGLLAVGWVEHYGNTNLYNTLGQDLIAYSQAHDDLFPNAQQPNGVIVGGYGFKIPTNAAIGEQYQIQIGRPTATSDGFGTPGSSVLIEAPTNGALAGGAINAVKLVTAGQAKYLVGNAYPFRWFNAGDFGNTNLQNADVEQVFESAAYGWNTPPTNTDFYDCMDSSGHYGVYDSVHGYYVDGGPLTLAQQLALFNATDPTTLNTNMFGDGKLDISDVYVTYIRSIDPDQNLNWIQRFWTNGIRAALPTGNVFKPNLVAKASLISSKIQAAIVSVSSTNQPKVEFSAGDIQGSAGQVIQIPINATILGGYPLRLLLLNLTVVPLDGSPALTTPVQFTQTAPLGAPYMTDARGAGNFSAAWLNSASNGVTGTVTLGTLTVTIPAGASGNAAYAVHFDHASGSPNGFASFPQQTLTGLITLSSRTNSSYGDGIPDSWRLRWFGTTNNLLSVSNACPAGDGIDNYQKFVAGVDPNIAGDFPSVNPQTPAPSGFTSSILWPTVLGKQYVIEYSSSLFPGSWTAVATNTGTGDNLEYDDSNAGANKFYRVLIVP